MSGLLDQHGRPVKTSSAAVQPYFRGTHRGRFRGPMTNTVTDSKNTLNSYSRQTLLGYARTIFENFGEVKGAISDLTNYAVGHGIRPQSLAGDVAEQYEQYFAEWAKLADLSGQRSFWQLQRLASLRMDIDGDLGFNLVTGAGDWPFLEAIESHRISSPKKAEHVPDGPRGPEDVRGQGVHGRDRPVPALRAHRPLLARPAGVHGGWW